MRVVVALGGNTLLKRGEAMTVENQRANVQRAAAAIAPVVEQHDLIVTHGNGPRLDSWPCRPRPIPASKRIP